jgi:hypothetical protein
VALLDLLATAPTWALGTGADGNPVVGPLVLITTPPDLTVTVIAPEDVPAGSAGKTVHIHENAQQFDITYYEYAGMRGLFHHRGRNWILWTTDLRHVFVARGTEEWARTWVYARFLLRHFIVAGLLQRPGYRRLHAVAGPLADRGTGASQPGGLLIAGPYLSGKTYLIEQLIAAGLVTELVEDDCAVISPDWEVYALLPAEHELRATRRLPVAALVCLDEAATTITPIAPEQAAHWAFSIQASWPVSWLPGASALDTTVGPVPTRLPCLRVPARPQPTCVAQRIVQLLP